MTNGARNLRRCLGLAVLGALMLREGVAAEPKDRASALPKLVLLNPGTRVDGPRDLPTGWNHLVIKSVPKLTSGDLASLPAVAKSTATLFRTALLVDVRTARKDDTSYLLHRVGVGLCTPVHGVDTVVSSATVDEVHAPLGVLDRIVLQKAEEELARGRIQAKTPTFALYSAPTLRKTPSGHEPVLLRYAILADARTGDVDTLLWAMAAEPSRRVAPERLVRLEPGLVNTTSIDVLAERVLDTVPVNWSFALAALPSGTPVPTTAAVRRWGLQDTFTPAEAVRVEADLRVLLKTDDARR